MPVAMISTSTSPAFGPSRSSSTISSGFFASNATAARVFIGGSPFRWPPSDHRGGNARCEGGDPEIHHADPCFSILFNTPPPCDRMSVVLGKRFYCRVEFGVCRHIQKKKKLPTQQN